MMPGVLRKLPSGARVLIHPCETCGSDRAPFGYFVNHNEQGVIA